MGEAGAHGAPNVGKDRSTRGCQTWGGQKHTRVLNRGRSRSTRGCRVWGEQKHPRVPGEGRTEAHAGAQQVRGCRDQMSRAGQAAGGRTGYIHGRCARQDPRAHTHDLSLRANPRRPHTTRLPRRNLNPSVTGHHSGVQRARHNPNFDVTRCQSAGAVTVSALRTGSTLFDEQG